MALSASDLPALYALLANSLSSEESVRKPAESTLSQSENRAGFCSCLLEVITSKDLVSQADVRLMATVYFKNSISRYWRNRRDGPGISSEEKSHLRKKLLSHLREENDKIAVMLAVLISKIARFDYPREWPELFSLLAQQLQSVDLLSSHRIYLILFRSLKELSTKRLTADQKNFAEISAHLFDYSWNLWKNDLQAILHGFASITQGINAIPSENHFDGLYLISERWLLCMKIIRQLLISGFQSDSKCLQEVQPVKEVCPTLLNAIQSFLPYYRSFRPQHIKFWDFVKRACIKLMKVLIAIQGRHPYTFGDKSVLPSIINFCLNIITESEINAFSFEEFLIQCMVMVKCVLECKEYKPVNTGRVMDGNGISVEQTKRNMSSIVSGILFSLLPSERLILLCNTLIRRYFVLTTSDLEEWYHNPETFHHGQDVVQWTEKLRPCAEALYIVLFENNSHLLGPVVVSILQEAMNGCPPAATEITPHLLLKDAAYGAAAYVYYELSNYLSFNVWFNGALSHELSNDHPSVGIIHRKVALILGQWVSEVKDETKRAVYCGLIRLLQDKDLSVRLAACRSLCLHIEDANFSEEKFSDLLPLCWDSCFKLIEEVEEFDSKVQVLNLISVLIGHIREVLPFAEKLVRFFQKVWEESSGESLLQIQLLIALKNFVVALDYQSPCSYTILLPILHWGIDINNPDELNLLEDSLLLWETTLSHAPAVVPQLLTYFPCLVGILEKSFDHLQVAISIFESYIILGGNEFFSTHVSSISKLIDFIVGNVNDKGLLLILPVMDLLIQCYPAQVLPLITSSLQKLFIICLSGGDDYDHSKTAVKASSAALFARILVMDINYFVQLTAEPSTLLLLQQAGISNDENLLLRVVDLLIDRVDNASVSQRKMYGLALSVVLTLNLPQLLDRLDQILSVCTTVIMSGNEHLNEEDFSVDSMSSIKNHDEDVIPTKEFRKRQIKSSDPINKILLEDSVRVNLEACAALHGDAFNTAISKMHGRALEQLKMALKMG